MFITTQRQKNKITIALLTELLGQMGSGSEGIIWDTLTALQLTIFKPLYMLNSAERPNLTGFPFAYVSICHKLPS